MGYLKTGGPWQAPYLGCMKRIRILFILLALGQTVAASEIPTGRLDNPYQVVLQHLYWLQKDTYRPPMSALVMPEGVDSTEAVKRSIQLKQILDGKGLYVHLDNIPRDTDYRDSVTGQTRYVLFPLELPVVYVEERDGSWRYSRETWEAIPQLHRSVYPFGSDRLITLFGKGSQETFMGIARWQWGGILGLVLGLFVLYWILYFLFIPLLRAIFKRIGFYNPEEFRTLQHFDRYFTLLILARLALTGIPALMLPAAINMWLLHGIRIAAWLMVLMMGLRFIDLAFGHLRRMADRTDTPTDNQLLPFLRRGAQAGLWILVLIPVLRLLDVNFTALIAGLSIGGLALALAAQDTVKNLISTLIIFIDHPYRLGNYIKAAGVEGTVVEIGLRSTRMMTIDSSIITIPNSNMINNEITNLGVRQFRLIHFMIGVTYDTDPGRMEAYIHALREMALAHPDTLDEHIMIYLSGLNASSIDIRFRTAILAPDIRTEYQIQEELVMAIIRHARMLGISFAFPSQSVYVEQWPAANGMEEDLPEDREAARRDMVEKLTREWLDRRTKTDSSSLSLREDKPSGS